MLFMRFCSGYKGISVVVLAMLSANLVLAQTNASPTGMEGKPPATRTLRPNDQISVSVYQEPDLDVKQIAIDEQGTVILPLLGSVKVGGLTVEEATERVRALYDKDYLVNPAVSITLDQFARLRFTVLGQVQRPGSYDYPQNEKLNLLECIAIAQGYTRLGSPSKIKVQRIVDGKPKIFDLDAGAMAKDKKNKPFEILPDDLITVGERVF